MQNPNTLAIERLLSREEMQDDPHMEISDWRAENRRTHSEEFKAKVGLEALKGQKTNKEIGCAYGVHPILVGKWKNLIQRCAKNLFEGRRGPKPANVNKMGRNSGYTIFEATVIGAYDLGKLDKNLLSVLMEPYRDSDSDIDSGGSCDLESKEGKRVKQVVIETWGLEMPPEPECEYDDDPDSWDNYHDRIYELMRTVTDHFGWR